MLVANRSQRSATGAAARGRKLLRVAGGLGVGLGALVVRASDSDGLAVEPPCPSGCGQSGPHARARMVCRRSPCISPTDRGERQVSALLRLLFSSGDYTSQSPCDLPDLEPAQAIRHRLQATSASLLILEPPAAMLLSWKDPCFIEKRREGGPERGRSLAQSTQ